MLSKHSLSDASFIVTEIAGSLYELTSSDNFSGFQITDAEPKIYNMYRLLQGYPSAVGGDKSYA